MTVPRAYLSVARLFDGVLAVGGYIGVNAVVPGLTTNTAEYYNPRRPHLGWMVNKIKKNKNKNKKRGRRRRKEEKEKNRGTE